MAPAKEKKNKAEALPMDVVRIILLKSTPTSLRKLQAVCKDWRQLIRSPDFIKERRGSAWMVGVGLKKQQHRGWAWVWLYDPIANQREKVEFPLLGPGPIWEWKWKVLVVQPAEQPGELIVVARFARRRVEYFRWNPITGFIETLAGALVRDFSHTISTSRMQRVLEFQRKEVGWMYTVSSDSKSLVLVGYIDCIKIFKKDEVSSHWEVAAVMPDEIWQAIGQEEVKAFVAAPGYVLMWTEHRRGEHAEVVVMLNLETGGWRMVENKWHTSSTDLCMWASMEGPFFPTFC